MADDQKGQSGKREIEEGMSEAGKGQAKGGEAGKGQRGHGADPSKLTEGMSEAGSGKPPNSGKKSGFRNGPSGVKPLE